MNNKLLDDEAFTEMTQSRLETLRKSERAIIHAELEEFKQAIKMETIERLGVLEHEQAKEEKQLRVTLNMLVFEECKSPGLFIDDTNNIKNKLQAIDT